jgi:hypothetical protein
MAPAMPGTKCPCDFHGLDHELPSMLTFMSSLCPPQRLIHSVPVIFMVLTLDHELPGGDCRTSVTTGLMWVEPWHVVLRLYKVC